MLAGQRIAVLMVSIGSIILISQRMNFGTLIQDYGRVRFNNPEKRRLVQDANGIDFSMAKSLAKDVLNLIQKRYELDTPLGSNFLLTAANMGAQTWDIMKYKFALKMLQKGQKFLMTFGGSSVTAGHDNRYNQSYPAIVEKRMSPILKALGIEMEVHNIAMGANNCVPYILCYETMGGMNPDFIAWEQSYNCGHDDSVFETAARIAAFSDNHAVAYYSASGAWNPEKCPKSNDSIPYSSEDWNPDRAGLSKWDPKPEDLEKEKDRLSDYYKASNSANRFTPFTKSDAAGFRAVGAHGFNVWEPNPKSTCTVKNSKKEKCSGIEAAQDCTLKFMTHEAGIYGSENGRGAGWHPTRGFHMLRGEFIVWDYTLPLLDSIFMVEEALKKDSADTLIAKYKTILAELQPPLPAPKAKKCDNLNCHLRPKCYTNYMPHYSQNMSLAELIVGKTNWSVDYYAPVGKVNTSFAYGEWSIKYGYLDTKPKYSGGKNSTGELHIKIKVDNSSFVWLCGDGKEPLKYLQYYLDKDVKNPGPDYVPSANRTEWTKKKYVGYECKAILDLPQGEHVLSIANAAPQKEHSASLTHVIMWP